MLQNQAVKGTALTTEQFFVFFLICVAFLIAVYFIIDAIEKAKVKKLTKPKYIYLKTSFLNKYIDKLFQFPIVERLIKQVSYKLSYLNSSDARVNYRNALLMIISTVIMALGAFILMVVYFKSSVWYLYLLYIVIIVLTIYIALNLYSDIKETALSKQLPEALNDLKIAYDNKKRIKLAIIHSYEDMPKDIKKEFSRLAESDNLEEAIAFLRNRVRNPWFKIVLTLILLAVKKGDKEGALSDQLQNLNGIISQEILIKESNKMLFQLYKIFVLILAPAMALYMRSATMGISQEISNYYQTPAASNALAGLLITCIVSYFILDIFEKV